MNTNDSIIHEVLKEYQRAKKKFPSWPVHIVARAAIVGEESGELIQAALQWKYERQHTYEGRDGQYDKMKKEAIQTAAMCLRFLEMLPDQKD
jgi:hypothetical protein